MTPPTLTVGFLVDSLAQDYQRRVFAGVDAAGVRLNVNIVCLVGGALGVGRGSVTRSRLYSCATPSHLDGVVVLASTLGNHVRQEALSEFVDSYRPLPICSVGVALEDAPSVTVDNESGERQALSHLIDEQRRRRIAFIRGPRGNAEAEERYEVYRALLEERSLGFEPDLVVDGDYQAPSGAAGIATLIDERHMAFDAVMAASDLMALGALNALVERRVKVPEQVSVVGFDDIEAARFASAPLTTVRQPLEELGARALESVVAQAYEAPSPSQRVLAARLIRRRSSGWRPASRRNSPVSRVKLGATVEERFGAARGAIQLELAESLAEAQLEEGWATQLYSAFLGELFGRREGLLQPVGFHEQLRSLLFSLVENGQDSTLGQRVLLVLRACVLPLAPGEEALRERMEDLWHEAGRLCANVAERQQVQRRLDGAHWRRAVQDVGTELLMCDTGAQLADSVLQHLPDLGIPLCSVATFADKGRNHVRVGYWEHARAVRTETSIPRDMLLFSEAEPRERCTYVVQALHIRAGLQGFALFQMGPSEPEVYGLLADYITGALRGLQD